MRRSPRPSVKRSKISIAAMVGRTGSGSPDGCPNWDWVDGVHELYLLGAHR